MRLIRGPQVVVGVVVQGRRVAPAGDHEGDDREDRGRLPLDDRAGARREAARSTSAIFARTSFRAWTMSVPGTKSMLISAAPRTDFDRTRCTPSTTFTASSMGRVTPISTSLTARPGVCDDHRRSAERPPRDRCRWACAASRTRRPPSAGPWPARSGRSRAGQGEHVPPARGDGGFRHAVGKRSHGWASPGFGVTGVSSGRL